MQECAGLMEIPCFSMASCRSSIVNRSMKGRMISKNQLTCPRLLRESPCTLDCASVTTS